MANPVLVNMRIQVIDQTDAADVLAAIESLESKIGVTLSHNQVIVALARHYLKTM